MNKHIRHLGVLVLVLVAFMAFSSGAHATGSGQEGILDPDYDDRWAKDFPQTIGGLNVGHISTPKDRACSSTPVVYLQTTRGSLEDFLSNPHDINALKAALGSLDGVPSDIRLSFSPNLIDRQTGTVEDAAWNAQRMEHGCDVLADTQIDDYPDGNRAFAVFQNTDAGKYTDDNAQSVKIRTPSGIGTGQTSFSAALNNVKSNTGYFMQAGMVFREGDPYIAWTEDHLDLKAQRYTAVPYYGSTLYQFSITYTSNSWYMCEGNDGNINQYECIASTHATGTHLKKNVNTSVFFENANTNDDWHSGFPNTIAVSHAKIHRNGTGQAWSTEDRWSIHACGGDQYPVAGAMNGTLKSNGAATWVMNGIPLACP